MTADRIAWVRERTAGRGADVDGLPKMVTRSVPDLKVRCGPCIWLKNPNMDRFQPETLFFGE